jgi:PDZ domain-containing secreted protein
MRRNVLASALATRWLAAGVAVLGLSLLSGPSAWAQQDAPEREEAAEQNTHSGTVVSVEGQKLTMFTEGKGRHTHEVTENTKITLNCQEAELNELQKGDVIRVTMKGEQPAAISATRREGAAQREAATQRKGRQAGQERREQQTHDESVLSVDQDQKQLIATSDEHGRHTHRITEDTKITLNGQKAELSELQRGDRIRVSMKGEQVATIQATRREGREREGREERGSQTREGRQKGQQQAALGVLPAQSQGGGVLIRDVAPQGPAAQAGIRAGDYILSIDEEDVSSPQELTSHIEQLEPGKQVKITIWRQGREQNMTARLASREQVGFREQRQDQFPPRRDRRQDQFRERQQGERRGQSQQDQAWLGVQLQETRDQRGVQVARIFEGGPAARAGLRQGDVLLKIDDREVSSPDDASEVIERFDPNDRVELVVLRDGEEQELTATLANRRDFFGQQTQYGQEQSPQYGRTGSQQQPFAPQQSQRLERMIQELHHEVRSLRKEVQQLSSRQPGTERQERRDTQPQQPQRERDF